MRYFKLIFFLLFFCNLLKSQYESDRLVMGGGTLNDNANPNIPFRNSIIYFNQQTGIDSIDASKWLKIGIYYNASSSSTWSRDTVMYVSNGYRIVNQRGQVIDPKILSAAFSNGSPGVLTGTQNVLFLSVKKDDIERLFMLYGEYRINAQGNNAHDTLFSYAELNPYQSWPPSVALVSKNNVLLTAEDSTLRGCIAATRHANGRDWWVMKPGNYSDVFYRGLVSPNGISPFERILTDVPHIEQYADGRTYFNADGNIMISYAPIPSPKRVYRYDFDRCTGELYNSELHLLTEWLPSTGVQHMCLSPDGSKLYIFRQPMNSSQQPGIIQYDFETQQANYIGEARIPFLSPNGKEVLMTNSVPDSSGPLGFNRYISIIKNPNESFANLNVEWNAINSVNGLALVPPNLAYYRLGAAQGTLCDSLGLSANAVEDWPEISVFPNPSNGDVHLRLAQWPGGSYSLHNSLGQPVAQAALAATSHEQVFNLALPHLPNGLYFLSLRNTQGQVLGSRRLLILRE
jgi:hypothetical protein